MDDSLTPYPDQWTYLSTIQRISPEDIHPLITQATGKQNPLCVCVVEEEQEAEPWKKTSAPSTLSCPLPSALKVTIANLIYFEKSQLPQPLANQIVRIAAFQNPEFYKAQAMRMSVWNKPRIIGCAQNFPGHIGLPRGCLDAVFALLKANGITPAIQDERFSGISIDVSFRGTLRPDQDMAVNAMLSHDTGVLCAPTAFGKTVSAAAMIAQRGVSTLILVHRTELLRQWQERLQAFLGLDKLSVGTIGGGKAKLTGIIDIAVVQSLSRKGEISDVVKGYGQVIVDECHHLSAVSFEALLRSSAAKYVMGLTATPIVATGNTPSYSCSVGQSDTLLPGLSVHLMTFAFFLRHCRIQSCSLTVLVFKTYSNTWQAMRRGQKKLCSRLNQLTDKAGKCWY